MTHQNHHIIMQFIYSIPTNIIIAISHYQQTWQFKTLPRIKVPLLKPKPSWVLAKNLSSHLLPPQETFQYLFDVIYKTSVSKSSSAARNKMTLTRTNKHHNHMFNPIGNQTLANFQRGLPGDWNNFLIKSLNILNENKHWITSLCFKRDFSLL